MFCHVSNELSSEGNKSVSLDKIMGDFGVLRTLTSILILGQTRLSLRHAAQVSTYCSHAKFAGHVRAEK